MTSTQASGFYELQHTADWELKAWAPDLAGLLEQAARGMYTLSGVHLYPEPRLTRILELSASDAESLLVKFLSELLYLGEQYGMGFDTFELRVNGNTLRGKLAGAPMAEQAKEIKAVTYHNLAIQSGPRGLEVQIVFDV
jgi:SHS2 domain-containing protein